MKVISKYRYVFLLVFCIFASALNIFPQWQDVIFMPNQILMIVLASVLAVIYLFIFRKGERFGEKNIIFLIFAFGIIFRLVYTQATDFYVRQHDVSGEMGHLDYFMRLYEGEGLPTEIEWQYYQPPAWHSLCALLLKIQSFFGIPLVYGLENLQLLSLFCSCSLMFLCYRLFKMFGLNGFSLYAVCGIIAFHPTLIILSASVNNDILSITLSLLAVILALKWYREPKFSWIILLAFAIGLSMAVKLSGGLIALGTATLFAVRLFGKSFKNKGSLLGQFACFLVICVPLALWWQVRNLIKFGIPITYVPMMDETNPQYIGWRTAWERLLSPSALKESLFDAGVWPARMVRDLEYEFFEYNIFSGALKSSVFGEYYLGKGHPVLEIFSVILFWSAALLALISVISAVYVVIKAVRERKSNTENTVSELIFPLIISLTMIISYFKFCFDYAFFCTMDFRYITLTLIFGALYLGLMMKNVGKNNKMLGMIVVCTVGFLTALMCVSSVAIYGTIA